MDKLVTALGITGLSKSQVPVRVREGGRVVKVSTLVGTGVNAEGYRESLGIQVAIGGEEATASWLGSFRDVVALGLTAAGQVGMETSDAAGLVDAIGEGRTLAEGIGLVRRWSRLVQLEQGAT